MNRKIVVEIRIRRMRFIVPISEQEFKNHTDNQIKYLISNLIRQVIKSEHIFYIFLY